MWRSGLNDTVSEENETGNADGAAATRRSTAARPMAGGGSKNRNQRQSDQHDDLLVLEEDIEAFVDNVREIVTSHYLEK